MTPTETDRLRRRRDTAATALDFAAGRDRGDLDADLMLRFALTRAVEIIGEAAARLPDATRAAHPEVPWANVIGMRNRLAHGDFDVDPDILWRTVTERLPGLIPILDAMLAPETPPAPP